MKQIEEQTYYEILEVNSHATAKEIQRAYENAKETYHRDSLAIYSLFSEGDEKY
jgi:DnaJ-class molecular chaperone